MTLALTLMVAAAGAVLGAATDAHAIIGRPLTPMSYAGVARRTVRRSSYVAAGAAVATTAAVAATAAPVAVLPSGCVAGMNCGGVVYQPAYSGTTVVYVPH